MLIAASSSIHPRTRSDRIVLASENGHPPLEIRRALGLMTAAVLMVSCSSDKATDVSPGALTVTSTSLPTANKGSPYSATFEAKGGTPPYRWNRILGELPGGIGLDQGAGTLVGTPTQSGDFTFTARVWDAVDSSADAQFTMQVIGPPPLEIVPFDTLSVTIGTSFTAQFQATGGELPYLWYASTSDGTLPYSLPAGLTLDSVGRLTGTPAYPAGTYRFLVVVTSFGFTPASEQVDLIVRAPSNLRIETTSIPDMHQGELYSASVQASGGAPPYNFEFWQKLPPSGVTIGSNRTVSGVPTENTLTTTRLDTLGVLVTDAVGATAFTVLTFNYIAAPVSIPDFQLPDGVVGVHYEFFLNHTGPLGSDVWSVSAGTLPDGIQLVGNGLISGNSGARLVGQPTTVGVFHFQLTVTSQGQNGIA
jgi:hypothetical protein